MHAVRWIIAAAVATPLVGCESGAPKPAPAAPSTSTAPNASLEALTASDQPGLNLAPPTPDTQPRTDLEREAALAAANLERLLASGALSRAAQPQPEPPPVPEPDPFTVEPTAEFVGPDATATAPPEPAPEPFDPTIDLAQRMARLLRDPGAGKTPMPPAVALGPIEALEPGILSDLEAPDNRIGPKLSEEDRQALIIARDAILANPGSANESLVRALSKLAPPPTLKIANAALCTRVRGFGHYDPFPSSTFLHGQPIRAIVYVELDGFTTRPAREGDPVQSGASLSDLISVDLSQSLSLYQDPGGLLSWHRPARPVVETTRNKRRDFYVIQQIELPAGLSIGRYNLKVAVKDRTSGAEAETILPITIVADRSAQR